MTLRKGTIVKIDGCIVQLTDRPRKAINGSWLVFYRDSVGGKVHSGYATADEIAEWEATTKEWD